MRHQRLRDAVQTAVYRIDPGTREMCADIPLDGLDGRQLRILAETLKVNLPFGPSTVPPRVLCFRSPPAPRTASDEQLSRRRRRFRENVISTIESQCIDDPVVDRFAALAASHRRSYDTTGRRPEVEEAQHPCDSVAPAY